MKNAMKVLPALITGLLITACVEGEQKQEVKMDTKEEVKKQKEETVEYADAEFKDGMVESAFQYYLQLKMALINSDAKGAGKAAANLEEDLTDEHQELRELAISISESDDIEQQREQFSKLTASLEPIFRESITNGAIYKQYCPMAFNNKGAYWLSETKEIKNPYFGDKMLKCGSTKETITK